MDISIVIPTYKRYHLLIQCLDSVLQQDYPLNRYEVIVVDDAQDDHVRRLLEEFKQKYPNLKYLAQNHKGPAAARNLGTRFSSGEIVGFIDDDCVANKDWAELMVKAHLENPAISAIGGLTVTPTQKSTVSASQFLSNCSIETFFKGANQVIFFPTCNVSLKSSVFKNHQFDENFPFPGGEDLEFFWKLYKEKHRFIWNKGIKAVHWRNETTRSFLKQAYIYGRGNLLVQYLHGDQPLLKELKTGPLSFWLASLINFIKIPRFSYLLGNRLIRENNIEDARKKISIYTYFILHKLFYILGNIAEFIRIRNGYLSKKKEIYVPHLFILDITHSCNLRCRICDIWKTGNQEKDIDLSYIKKMLGEAQKLKIKEIALSGGEALMRGDIFEIFAYARELKIKRLGVLTNGILVKEKLDELTPYLVDNTISLVISLDSLKQELHNFIRNSSTAWQDTMKALELLSVMKKKKSKVNFNVISIILDQNLEELSDLARYIKSLGANSLQFQALLPNNLKMSERKKSSFWVPEERMHLLDSVVDKLMQLKKENPEFVRNSVGNLELVKRYFRGTLTSAEVECVSAFKTILVSNQGNCTTCFSTYGDMKTNKLENVLTREAIERNREAVRNCSWPCLLPCFCDS